MTVELGVSNGKPNIDRLRRNMNVMHKQKRIRTYGAF